MVSALDSGLGAITRSLSQCLSANCQGNLMKCWEVSCDGLASHPGGVGIRLVASCYGNWDKPGH